MKNFITLISSLIFLGLSAQTNYENDILPIFDSKCNSCHGINGSAGLNLTTSYHAIQASSGNSVEFETVAPVIFNGLFDTSFSLKLACKDLGLMTQLGELHKIPLDFTKFIEEVFIDTKNRHGENAWTPSMVNDIEQETGLNLREPNFPNKMMDYQDVVNFLDKNQNSK